MTAIIIENQWEVDSYIKAFLKDNPNLFTKVQEELYCLQRRKEELLPKVLANDAIIVASTFMYKDQLEEFLLAFTNPKFPKKTFFVHWITSKMNNWKNGWSEEKELFELCVKLYNQHTIYDFTENDDEPHDIIDGLGTPYPSEFPRYPYRAYKVSFSKKHRLFYSKNEPLKIQIDEEQRRIKS